MSAETPVPADEVTYDLPGDVEAAALARRYVEHHAGALAAELLEDAQLLVSEIVTNAVLHGRPAITLRLRVEPPKIGVAVADQGSVLPPHDPRVAGPDETSGRGLLIVASLASAWGVDPAPSGGKTVWFELHP